MMDGGRNRFCPFTSKVTPEQSSLKANNLLSKFAQYLKMCISTSNPSVSAFSKLWQAQTFEQFLKKKGLVQLFFCQEDRTNLLLQLIENWSELSREVANDVVWDYMTKSPCLTLAPWNSIKLSSFFFFPELYQSGNYITTQEWSSTSTWHQSSQKFQRQDQNSLHLSDKSLKVRLHWEQKQTTERR